MSLDTVVTVNITTLTASVSQAGFGVPMLASYFPTSVFPERVRTYTSLAGMTADGFAATDPAYLMATALKSQNASLPQWKVGRRALPSSQTFTLTPTITTEGEVLSLTVEGTAVTYTIPGAATVNSIATALQPLINAITGVTAVDATGSVTITPTTANDLLSIASVSKGLTIKDNTPDPGVATDLAAIEAEDAEWYGLLIDSESEAEINATAAWAESRKILFLCSTIDSEVKDSGVSTDVGSDLETAGYARTALLFSDSNQQYGGARWMGKMFPKNPGSATWAYKTLAGFNVTPLTAAEVTALDNKTVNHYTSLGGVSVTRKGYASSGEYIDITRGVDWFRARLQERIYSLLVKLDKLPYTDQTGDLFRAEILAQMQEALSRDVLTPNTDETPWVIDVPLVANQSAPIKAGRIFADIEFSAYLAGAVHTISISGTLSV